MIVILSKFWCKHPALLYGLSVLLGICCTVQWNYGLLFPMALIWGPLCLPSSWNADRLATRLLLGLVLFFLAIAYFKVSYQFPDIPETTSEGLAHITISSVTASKTRFSKVWLYKGTLVSFIPHGSTKSIARNIPYRLTIPNTNGSNRIPANSAYVINARLKESSPKSYSLTPDKWLPWQPVAHSFSLAEYRFHMKNYVSDYIRRSVKGETTANFLIGLSTGDFSDNILTFELSRFGLQHILAISGFHFGIIAAIINFMLRCFFSRKVSAVALIALLTGYFIFLGGSPSIMRAWLTISIFVGGQILEKSSVALNSLGLALLLILISEPLMYLNLGFQFSFLVTAAILMFYAPAEYILQKVLKKRKLEYLVDMNHFDQHCYLFLSYLRQALALTIAVNIIALPMTLFIFHKFPWMSLIYNLFFPFLVSFSMLLLLIALLLSPLPFLSEYLQHLNSYYTQFVLDFVFKMPMTFDYYLRIASFPLILWTLYVSTVFALAIFINRWLEHPKQSPSDYAFI